MKKKGFIQACNISGSIYGRKNKAKRSTQHSKSSINKKEVVEVYNKFYRDQVSALYRAIHGAS